MVSTQKIIFTKQKVLMKHQILDIRFKKMSEAFIEHSYIIKLWGKMSLQMKTQILNFIMTFRFKKLNI
jgi:hypothetical protein